MFPNLVVGRLHMKETTVLKSKREIPGEARPQLKIGEVAKLSGIGIEALRFYEKSGLLGRPLVLKAATAFMTRVYCSVWTLSNAHRCLVFHSMK